MTLTPKRGLVLGAITLAAAALMIGSVGPAMLAAVRGAGMLDDVLAASAILNVALVLLSWRLHASLRSESGRRATAEDQVAHLTRNDALTGLLNRHSFLAEATTLLGKSSKRNRDVAMLLLDLDHFKTVNDVSGHEIGDATLKLVGELVRINASEGALAARLGADEFGVMLSFEPGRPDLADALAARLVADLDQPLEVAGAIIHTGGSIGIARTDTGCDSIEKLMRRADIAMFASKNAGRNRYHWFDVSMERELSMRNAIEANMRDGIPLGQFVPYYEQQVDLASGKLQGFEMLARWEHPTRGIVPPDIFIPIAEETGMIADLSTSVMRQAFEEAKNWDPSLTLSVNVAPSQLKDPWFAHKIIKLLVETGFPANRLEVEITERALVENMGVAQSIVGSLKNQGIRIALDDFGTGYSSLSNLRALPFDRVKIDRSFVTSLATDSESNAVVNAITRLSDSLGLPVTAEGVETPEIEARLRTMGCYQGQGWHFGKPMDVGQVRAMLAERNLLPVRRLGAPAGERVRELRRLG